MVETSSAAPSAHAVLPRPGLIALVAVGGAVGTTIRYMVMTLFPVGDGFPTVIAVINISGALVLGLLLETIALAGAESTGRRNIRLVIGTGVLGGYTTYGTFAVTEDGLIQSMNPHDALLFGVPMVAAGIVAALVGVWVVHLVRRAIRRDAA
mgnify:FL=1